MVKSNFFPMGRAAILNKYTLGTFLTKFQLYKDFCTLLPVINVLRLNCHCFPLSIAWYFICVQDDPYLRLFQRRNKDFSHSLFTQIVVETCQGDVIGPFRRTGFQQPGKQKGEVCFPFIFGNYIH